MRIRSKGEHRGDVPTALWLRATGLRREQAIAVNRIEDVAADAAIASVEPAMMAMLCRRVEMVEQGGEEMYKGAVGNRRWLGLAHVKNAPTRYPSFGLFFGSPGLHQTAHHNAIVPSADLMIHLNLHCYMYDCEVTVDICGHRTLKAPHPVRSAKLSKVSPSQYCGGGPRGNPRCCSFFLFFFDFSPNCLQFAVPFLGSD